MASEAESKGEVVSPGPLDDLTPAHQDELTMKQQEEIDKEISSSNPLIGRKENLLNLANDYAEDKIYQDKVNEIHKRYPEIRRMRPDGNCFYRAFSFGVLERCLTDSTQLKAFREKIVASRDLLKAAGFTQFTVDDFYDSFIEILDKVGMGDMTPDKLKEEMEEPSVADYLVVYLRIVTSAELKKSAEFYSNFIEGEQSLDEFCQLEVEPMYKESDHIHIIALTSALQVGVRIVYMDRGSGAQHDFPEAVPPVVNMLYRPGHYDLVYPTESL